MFQRNYEGGTVHQIQSNVVIIYYYYYYFFLLQESQELINKCQQQERKISSWNKQPNNAGDVSPSEVPPAPLLMYRSSSMLVFKTAPFNSMGGKKVGHDFAS